MRRGASCEVCVPDTIFPKGGEQRAQVQLPAGIEIVTWARRPELARGMYEVDLEIRPDIPCFEDVAGEPFEDWMAHQMHARIRAMAPGGQGACLGPGRSGSVPPWTAAAVSTAYWSLALCRPRKVAPGRNCSRSPSKGQRVGPAGSAPLQRIRGGVEEHLAGEGVILRVQQRKLARQIVNASVAGEPVEEDATGGHGVLGS